MIRRIIIQGLALSLYNHSHRYLPEGFVINFCALLMDTKTVTIQEVQVQVKVSVYISR